MSLLIDIAIIFIVALCAWRGYKDGLIRGAFGFVALIVSLFVSNIVAAAYSDEFTGMLKPFVSGIIESTFTEIYDEAAEAEKNGTEPEPFDFGPYEDEPDDFKSAYMVLRRMGLPEAAAARVAQLAVEAVNPDADPDAEPGADAGTSPGTGTGPGTGLEIVGELFFAELIADKLSSILSYVALFAIGFILLAIVFTVIGNLVGVVFSLPGLEIIDRIAGGILGLLRGMIIVFALAAVVRYVGILASSMVDATSILKYLVNTNPIAVILGI